MYGKSVLLCQVARARYIRNYSQDSTKKLLEFLADMPKVNTPRITEAQRQRQNISRKAEKYGPSTVYLQVLGSGAHGVPNTLYLFTDQKRYLFNCGECTQRLAHEHKVKLSRLDHIFITSKTWRNIGGLPGLSLTLQDVGVPNITLHGPEGLDELYNATKRFVIMKEMNVTMAKCTPSEDFDDNVMSVKYVLLGPHDDILVKDPKPAAKKPKLSDSPDKEYEEFINDDTDYYRPEVRHMQANKHSDPKKHVHEKATVKPKVLPDKVADPMKKKTEKVLHELVKQSHCSVAYICTLKKRLGTLDLAKCVEMGVKPGPLLGQLKSGHDVVLPNGTLVLSKDVKTPDDPGPVFIVLEVPDISYLKEAEFSAHFDNGVNPPENVPALIVHYTPPHVFHHPAYTAFMSLFGPSVRHLILNGQNSCLGSEAVHRTQHKLHLLDPDIFPLLRDVSVPAVWNAHPPLAKTSSPARLKGLEELKNKIALAQFQNIINMEGTCKGDGRPSLEEQEADKLECMEGRTLTMFHLRPKRQLDRSAEPRLHIQEYIEETMDVDGFVGSLEQFRRVVDGMRFARSGAQREFPKVVFLGTGSCIPSKTRNTSAIMLQIDEERSMLMDCGEGTFGQLVRFYGPKRVNGILRTITAVYVSHLHADHHIGLFGVLQARRLAFEELDPTMQPDPVYLLAPGQIMSWLTIYDQQFERIRSDVTLIPNQSLLMDSLVPSAELTSAVLARIGLSRIQTCVVSHCPNAFGVTLEVGQHKITYSGDTIPCEALVKCGENSTLLIHEATMEDELADEARAKMHSTTTQAIDIGRHMNAKFTVLTHFSQRYARLPRLSARILNDNDSVGIAFDNMQITMSDLELLPHMYAPLQLMFAEHCVEMELKAAHRARRKDRRGTSPSSTPDIEHGRKVSPGCRGARSPPRTRYRESNSSRLRQELKGMTLSGTMSRPPRSTSSSPKSANSSRSTTPCPGLVAAADKPLDVITAPCTMSETSNVSKNIPCHVRGACATPFDCFADTRSKTLNSCSRLPTPAGTAHSSRAASDLSLQTHQSDVPKKHKDNDLPVAPSVAYGKPLVTPMNRRLSLRREVVASQPPSTMSIKSSTVQSKSPIKQKTVNRRCPSPTSGLKRELSKPRLPNKVSDCKKLRPNGSGNVAFGVARSPVTVARGKITVSPPQNKSSPSRQQAKSESRPHGAKHDESYTKLESADSSTNRNVVYSDENGTTRPNRIPTINKLNTRKTAENVPRNINGKDTQESKSSHVKSLTIAVRRPHTTSNVTRRDNMGPRSERRDAYIMDKNHTIELTKRSLSSLPSLRDTMNDSRRRQPARDNFKPMCVDGRTNSTTHSMRSFKPQLEDIKSSFILLNKKANPRDNDEDVKGLLAHPLPKPKPLDEKERREMLNKVKLKFQSRGFWHESKYDKIEGLNWISWK